MQHAILKKVKQIYISIYINTINMGVYIIMAVKKL